MPKILLTILKILCGLFTIPIVIYLLFAAFNYADPLNKCNITISEKVLGGNKDTIIQALKLVRSTDSQSYTNVCSKINKIYERPCFEHDPTTTRLNYLNQTGCVIKGTKTIYIHPQSEDTQEVIEKRAKEIIRLSKLL